jgi:hypothetical protein
MVQFGRQLHRRGGTPLLLAGIVIAGLLLAAGVILVATR